MRICLLVLAFAVVFLPAKIAYASSQQLCTALRKFVTAVQPNETQRFEFHTSWMNGFNDQPPGIYVGRRCNDFGYVPAQGLCGYLMQHGAVEFPERDFARVLTCLSSKTHLDPELRFESVSLTTRYGDGQRGSRLAIELSEDKDMGGMVLVITADGY